MDGGEVTRLLARVRDGDEDAFERLMPLVYDTLREVADRRLRKERVDHTLCATALVHEAWFRLVQERDRQWENRRHFVAVAAGAMRRILVNHARDRGAVKRGGDRHRVALFEGADVLQERPDELLALDAALTRLEAFDAAKCRIVELRFFTGLSVEETAAALGVSVRSVERNWRLAKAWLRHSIETERADAGGAAGSA